MITIKSAREIESMAEAGRIRRGDARLVRPVPCPASAHGWDALAEEFIRSHPGARPFVQGSLRLSRFALYLHHSEIVTAFRRAGASSRMATFVSVDCGVCVDGLPADSAITTAVGERVRQRSG